MKEQKTRTALVLSGGSIRAACQIGILSVLDDYGIRPDLVIGTSGGAIVAAMYATGMSPPEMEQFFIRFGAFPRLGDYNITGLLRAVFTLNAGAFSGFLRADRLQAGLERVFGKNRCFADLESDPTGRTCPLLITGVNLNDGEETVFASPSPYWEKRAGLAGVRICSRMSIPAAIVISSSIPGIFTPYLCRREECPVNHALSAAYIDGGVRDNYPIATAVRLAGATRVLGIYLGYAGMRRETVVNGGIMEILGQTFDIFGHDQVEADRSLLTELGAQIVTINPLVYGIKTFDFQNVPWLIQRGADVARSFCREMGLMPGRESGAANLERIFSGGGVPVMFPVPGSALHRELMNSDRPREVRPARPAIRLWVALPAVLLLAVLLAIMGQSGLGRYLFLVATLTLAVGLALWLDWKRLFGTCAPENKQNPDAYHDQFDR